jgi:hypothetical protein
LRGLVSEAWVGVAALPDVMGRELGGRPCWTS